MNPIFNQNVFLVKEQIGMFKASNNFDIFNPENNELVLTCREPNLGFFTKLFRFTDYKRMTPFDIEIRTASGELTVQIKRGVTIFRSDIDVFDGKGRKIGVFKQKFFSFGGRFEVYDHQDKHLCTLQGKWTGWDFKFNKENKELATVSKKWAGLGKEFFTSADNYVINITDVAADSTIRPLLLAAVMCIDMVFKE
jgi:uncharacterized protein YxjI